MSSVPSSRCDKAQDVAIVNGSLNVVGRDQINIDQSVHTHVYHGATIAADTLEQSDSKNAAGHPNPPEGPIKNAPNPSALFQGRRSELNELKKFFKPCTAGDSCARRSLLVYGMGGMGKTQLCRKFAAETSDQFTHIFWIDGSTPETISLALKNLAGPKTTTSDDPVAAALQWISRLDGKWLLVFDNAEEHIHRFIPPGTSGNILITSRNRSVGRSTGFNSMEIHQMEEKDAVILLLKASCLDHTPDPTVFHATAKAIVNTLYCLPLAVDQAGAAIESGLCNINDYLQLYSRCRKTLLDDKFFGKASEYEQTVYGTWELSFQKIESISLATDPSGLPFSPHEAQTAIAILGIFAYLHHDNISMEIFRAAGTNWIKMDENERPAILCNHDLLQVDRNGKWDQLHFKHGIRVLLGFSLIKLDSYTANYSVHPLVHSWIQDRLPFIMQQRKCEEATKFLSCSVSLNLTSNNHQFLQQLVPHIQANSEGYMSFNCVATYDKNDCLNLGYCFKECGIWSKAEELFHWAWEICTNKLGREHPDTLTSMANLATIFYKQGRWKEAKELGVKVLGMRKSVLGMEHPDTLTSMSNLALTFCNQGQWRAAKDLEAEVLEIRKRVLGKEHPDTLTSTSNLALIFWSQGQWKESNELEVEVLDIRRRVLGTEHPDTLTSMSNLSLTFWSQGQWSEAEELEVKVLNFRKRLLGTEHPDTLTSMANLASIFWDQGQWRDAKELEAEVLDIRKRVLGTEHPDTLTSMSNLALTFWSQGQWKEAEVLEVEVLEIRKRVLGREHPDTLISMANLASTFKDQGRLKEAEELRVEVLGIRKRVLGTEHPDTLTSMSNLALMFWHQGRLTEAEELRVEVLDIHKRVLGTEHPDTLTSMANLASTFTSQGRLKEAEGLGFEVLDIRKRMLGPEHPLTLTSMASLASTFWHQGQWEKAEELEVEVLNIHKRVLGTEHPKTLTALHSLGLTYQSQQRWDEADELLTQAVELSRKILGGDHPDTQLRVSDLTDFFEEKTKAYASLRRSSKMRKLLKRTWHRILT
ncbi:hypothetical protein CVT26_005994 [Gymnopilus dilepis]|uniref:Orc1-like AAA ATPase domain-containing protein n=1 Tax=Gymnopilus dilepis TaxID=231916 RepID=A0A409Y1D8_9AGAR|nr:hypothetical protein CVT26_005994 [Gymnopilus dilepis]